MTLSIVGWTVTSCDDCCGASTGPDADKFGDESLIMLTVQNNGHAHTACLRLDCTNSQQQT
jgi:hypothetical protein